MQDNWQRARVIREDGVSGKVVTATTGASGTTMLIVQFEDGGRIVVTPDMLTTQANGSYRLRLAASQLELKDEIVIPVIAEELAVSKEQVERGVVRVHKRVETHEATLDVGVTSEEVTIERLPVNALVEGAAPQVREEDGVIVIPVLEEVLVVEKRLLLREEVRLTKRTSSSSQPQTVTLRRETVEIERSALDDMTQADSVRAGEEMFPTGDNEKQI